MTSDYYCVKHYMETVSILQIHVRGLEERLVIKCSVTCIHCKCSVRGYTYPISINYISEIPSFNYSNLFQYTYLYSTVIPHSAS